MRVLVIEDERKLGHVLRKALEAEGYKVVDAPTGDEGFGRATIEAFMRWIAREHIKVDRNAAGRGRGLPERGVMCMRSVRRLVTASFIVTCAAALGAQATRIDFEKDDVGKAPSGFTFALTGQGKPGGWIVRKDDAAHGNVMVQADADTTDYRFPVAIYSDFTGKDVDLSVQFKALSGKGDQGAGLVWRYRDKNNYYVTRCNALEDNCTIYHVINGRRQAFMDHRIKVASNTWHTLAVTAAGDHFVVTYDGQKVLDAKDEAFKEAGKVGLWTKADSVIAFDDLSIAGR